MNHQRKDRFKQSFGAGLPRKNNHHLLECLIIAIIIVVLAAQVFSGGINIVDVVVNQTADSSCPDH